MCVNIEDVKKRWKEEIYDKASEIDPSDAYTWNGLLLGFLLGNGVSLEKANEIINTDEFPY